MCMADRQDRWHTVGRHHPRLVMLRQCTCLWEEFNSEREINQEGQRQNGPHPTYDIYYGYLHMNHNLEHRNMILL